MVKTKASKRSITCIVCPIGCTIDVRVLGVKVLGVEGNTCARGEAYARKEVTHPVRTITSSVLVLDGRRPLVSVKTSKPVGKGRISQVMRKVRSLHRVAPVKVGDIICRNIALTGADLVATSTVLHKVHRRGLLSPSSKGRRAHRRS